MCGLSGYISNKTIPLQKNIIKTLGTFNDYRGGDSCGIFIDGEVEYGIGKEALFQDFYPTSKLFKETKEAKVVFTHCRKRSVGTITLDAAQPVVFRNEEGEIDYCLMHNGTIHNADDLWEKYSKEPLPLELTDSQIMATLFYNFGYEELANYNGAAAFVIVDYRKDRENPEVLFFKGSSIETHISKEMTEERPLFIAYTDFGLMFSSMYKSIACLTDNEILTIKSNCLCKYTKKGLVIVKKYDRSSKKQAKEYGNTYMQPYKNNYNDYRNYYDDYDDDRYNYNNQKRADTFNKSSYSDARVIMKDDKFEYKGKPAHGKFNCSFFGWHTTGFTVKEFWFFHGYMLLYGKETYDFIESIFKENSKIWDEYDDFIDYFLFLIRKYSVFPIINPATGLYEIGPDFGHTKAYSGSIPIIFSDQYRFKIIKEGKSTGLGTTSYVKASDSLDMIHALASQKNPNYSMIDWAEEKEKYLNYMNLMDELNDVV